MTTWSAPTPSSARAATPRWSGSTAPTRRSPSPPTCTPRYCFADPVEGGKQAIAEAWRNLCAVGATPLAATDCMNFGNPQRPEIMGQFVGCIEGMAEACRALDFPIVSGNVSLYNETKSEDGSGQRDPADARRSAASGCSRTGARRSAIGFKGDGRRHRR